MNSQRMFKSCTSSSLDRGEDGFPGRQREDLGIQQPFIRVGEQLKLGSQAVEETGSGKVLSSVFDAVGLVLFARC
jgi:hypothetical protein